MKVVAKSSRCLICYNDTSNKGVQSDDSDSSVVFRESSIQKSLISNHLHAIFILKCIFELPSNQLSEYLSACPNIGDWITICSKCGDLIDNCKAVYNELLEVTKKFRATRQSIIEIVKTSYNNGHGNKGRSGSKKISSIIDGCRQVINQYVYTGLSDPFNDGDAKALELMQMQQKEARRQEFGPPLLSSSLIDTNYLSGNTIVKEEIAEDETPDDDPIIDMMMKPNVGTEDPGRRIETGNDVINKQCPNKPQTNAIKKQQRAKRPYSRRVSPKPYLFTSSRLRARNRGIQKIKMEQNDVVDVDVNTNGEGNDISPKNSDADNGDPCDSETEKQKESSESESGTKKPKAGRLKKHKKTKKLLTKYTCTTCHKVLHSKIHFVDHINMVHGSYQCNLCPKKFRAMKFLNSHKRRIHAHALLNSNAPVPKTSIICNEYNCNAIIFSYKHLENHFRMEHKEKAQMVCAECGKGFYTYRAIHAHKKVHERVRMNKTSKTLTCEICGSSFRRIFDLNWHKKNTLRCKLLYQNESEATYICEKCGKKFANPMCLKIHITNVHERERIYFSCEHCRMEFKQKSNLQVHLLEMHKIGICDGKKFFKCSEDGCDKVFREKKRFQDHLTQHEGLPQYSCDDCGKQFYFRERLKTHIASAHAQEKVKVKCDVCGKELASKCNLKRHQRSSRCKT